MSLLAVRGVRNLVCLLFLTFSALPLFAGIEHHIDRAALRALDGPVAMGGKVRVTNVPVGDGTSRDLEMERFDIFLPNSAIVAYGADNQELERLPAPTARYFRGQIAGEPDSLAFLSISDARVEGFVFRGDRRFAVASRPRFATRDARRADGVDVFMSEVSDVDQIPLDGAGFTCDVEGHGIATARPRLSQVINGLKGEPKSDSALATGTATWVLNLAVETDYELYLNSGSSAPNVTTFIGNLIAAASTIYHRDLQTDLFVSFLGVQTSVSDPFTVVPGAAGTWNGNPTTFNTSHALYELGDRWHNTPPAAAAGLPRSSAVLISGKSQQAGVAWINVLCGGDFACAGNCGDPDANGHYAGGYAYCGGIDPPNDLSVPNPDANVNYVAPSTNYWPLLEFTHELGHNVGSSHTHCITLPGPDQVTYGRTFVDTCVTAGGCYAGATSVPTEKGTIMSYCHFFGGSATRFTFGKTGEASYVVPAAMKADVQGVTPPLSVITAPASVASGASGAASVTSVGGLTYAWTIVNGTINGSATAAAINFTATTNPVTLRVKATNAAGCSVTDFKTVTVTVACVPPTISSQPGSVTITAGQSTQLSVTPAGTAPFTYQWYTGTSGNTTSPVGGGTNSTLTVSPGSTTSYWVRVTGCSGNTVNSNTANVTVNAVLGAAVRRDFNADGRSDVFWRNVATGLNSFWYMNGGTFTGVSVPTVPLPWEPAVVGDFDGDGKADIFWRNTSTGQTSIWIMNGATYSLAVASTTIADLNWVPVGSGDFNGDGKADIFWRNASTGVNSIWIMNGITVSGLASPTVPAPWAPMLFGDFNGDGKSDVFWRNGATGETSIWIMNGATYTSAVRSITVADLNWLPVRSGDFNGDGRFDILWRNGSTGVDSIWLMNGISTPVTATSPSAPVAWTPRAVGDYNADGKADLFWWNSATGQTSVWIMNGANPSSTPGLLTVADPNWRPVSVQ
jgi:hypothetical protein